MTSEQDGSPPEGPRELIDRLKARLGPDEELPMPARVADMFTSAGVEPTGMTLSIALLEERLLNSLLERIPSTIRELFETGIAALGVLDDNPVNTRTERARNGGFAILFNRGLSAFVYRVARALATRMEFTGAPSQEAVLSRVETARIIQEIYWWYQEMGQPFGPDYPVSDRQIVFAATLASETELFFICHELGHVLDALASSSNASKSEPFRPHEDEHKADLIGLSLLLGLSHDAPLPHIQMAYAGAEFAMQIFRGLEQVGCRFPGTHPRAQARLETIRTFARAQCDEQTWSALRAVADAIDTLFAIVLGDMKNNTDTNTATLSDGAQAVIVAMDQLLARCSGEAVPDYSLFLEEMPSILNRGYPQAVMARIRQLAGRFAELLDRWQRHPPEEQEFDTEGWRVFQQYKLLFRLSEGVPEPARSAIRKALGWVSPAFPTG